VHSKWGLGARAAQSPHRPYTLTLSERVGPSCQGVSLYPPKGGPLGKGSSSRRLAHFVAAALPNLHTRALKLGDTTSLAGVWCALLAGFRLTRSTSTASPLDPVEGCAQALLLFLYCSYFSYFDSYFAQNSLPPIYSAILIAAISYRADKPFTPHPP
jgi:hypothetical protein